MRKCTLVQQRLRSLVKHKNYKEVAKEKLEANPELFVVALGIVIAGISIIAAPVASEIAYKSGVIDISKIAFKYVNGGF